MVKLKPKPPTVNCSPLKRRNFLGGQRRVNIENCTSGFGAGYGVVPVAVPVVPGSLKNTLGVRRIISQYTEVRLE